MTMGKLYIKFILKKISKLLLFLQRRYVSYMCKLFPLSEVNVVSFRYMFPMEI